MNSQLRRNCRHFWIISEKVVFNSSTQNEEWKRVETDSNTKNHMLFTISRLKQSPRFIPSSPNKFRFTVTSSSLRQTSKNQLSMKEPREFLSSRGDWKRKEHLRMKKHQRTIMESWIGSWLKLLSILEQLHQSKGNTIPNPMTFDFQGCAMVNIHIIFLHLCQNIKYSSQDCQLHTPKTLWRESPGKTTFCIYSQIREIDKAHYKTTWKIQDSQF